MATRKRKQEAVEEELQALPSDESEEEEEWVLSSHSVSAFDPSIVLCVVIASIDLIRMDNCGNEIEENTS